MCDTPATLEDLCLDAICDKILNVFELYYETVEETGNFRVVHKKFRFKDSDIFLFNEISEKLLAKFGEKNLLCNSTLNLFSEKNTRLRNVKIKNSKKVTAEGLKILKQHKIVDLDCINLKNISISKILGTCLAGGMVLDVFVTIDSFSDCLGSWSISNITNLNLSKCSFVDSSGHSLMVKLTNFKNLRSLNVSYTELNQQSLQMICEDLRFLEKLDISGTVVQDLDPLLLLSDQLVSITISVSILF